MVVSNFKLAWFYEKLDDFVNTNLMKNFALNIYAALEAVAVYMQVQWYLWLCWAEKWPSEKVHVPIPRICDIMLYYKGKLQWQM